MELEAAAPAAGGRTKRVLLAMATVVIGMNIWIGGPLLALWIGSRLQAHAASSLTITPATALTVFASLAVISGGLLFALGRVSAAYDRARGAGPPKRRHDRWIASDEGASALSAVERILVVIVAIAALTFEIWFFFFSTSPIDQRSGRSAVPVARAPARLLSQHPLLAALQEAQADRQRAEQAGQAGADLHAQ